MPSLVLVVVVFWTFLLVKESRVPPECEVLEPIALPKVFTFEINRHGARAPYWNNPIAMRDFPVSTGMLSP